VRPDDAYDMVVYQTGALLAFALAANVRLAHVKPHGALYNMAARDRALADAIATAVRDVDDALVLFGLAGSELIRAGRRAGIHTAAEAFADRSYMPDGSLVPRGRPEAFVHDPVAATARAIRMVRDGVVTAMDGSDVLLQPDTICLHGDGPSALELARALRAGLEAAGIAVTAVAMRD
jgi:5-oxoprolinase (ATP-hydrolysing) subunit A